jgi:2'-5' RNA ligase
MDDALAALGFSPEIRPFKPHLTIARVKGKSAQGVAARLLATESVGALAVSGVDAIVLMQSVLSNQGATYSVVERFAL